MRQILSTNHRHKLNTEKRRDEIAAVIRNYPEISSSKELKVSAIDRWASRAKGREEIRDVKFVSMLLVKGPVSSRVRVTAMRHTQVRPVVSVAGDGGIDFNGIIRYP